MWIGQLEGSTTMTQMLPKRQKQVEASAVDVLKLGNVHHEGATAVLDTSIDFIQDSTVVQIGQKTVQIEYLHRLAVSKAIIHGIGIQVKTNETTSKPVPSFGRLRCTLRTKLMNGDVF